MQRKPGELATDLQIRGQLLDTPRVDAKQELVVVAVSDNMSTAAQKQANDLTRVQQVVERRRTTPGAVPPSAGALYPGLKVWMPPAFAPPVPPGRRG